MNRKNIEYLKLNIRMCIWEILISLAAFLIWLIAEHLFDMPGDNCEILMIIITAFMWIRTVRKLSAGICLSAKLIFIRVCRFHMCALHLLKWDLEQQCCFR